MILWELEKVGQEILEGDAKNLKRGSYTRRESTFTRDASISLRDGRSDGGGLFDLFDLSRYSELQRDA